jgi:predicted Fe-S protein YdhL (DUF1289 family)
MPDRPLPFPQFNAALTASPCVRHCCLDDNDICLGCFRSRAEIVRWGSASEGERRVILKRANLRKQRNRD